MTKRKHKSEAPKGFNQSLGRSLVNRSKGLAKEKKHQQQNNSNAIAETTGDVLKSITHESDVQEFFCNAELSNANFEATKNDIKLVESNNNAAIIVEKFEERSIEELHAKYGELLKIPRRPKPGTFQNAAELEALETAEFLEWRRKLAKLSEGSNVVITPFERNLEIWRQLWRVLERSHVVVQIVDARNPLLFRNIDLEKYVKEIDSKKANLLLINKADLLANEQIQSWREYFNQKRIEAIFWSSKGNEVRKNENYAESSSIDASEEEANEENESTSEENSSQSSGEEAASTDEDENDEMEENTSDEINSEEEEEKTPSQKFISSPEQLISLLHRTASQAFPELENSDEQFMIGLVGYPNVGKSSTINRLLQQKKTAVSATPGKTKHFQTLMLNEQITLCDCPGLTLPSFGLSNSEMILNGILPIAHMRDYYSPVQLLCNRIPRHILQQRYSILLPKQFSAAEKPVQAHDFLTSVAFLRGFMSPSGIPDCSRAARIVLLDIVNGDVIRWCAAPPNFPQEQFDQWTFQSFQQNQQTQKKNDSGATLLGQLERRNLLLENSSGNVEKMGTKLDREFFNEMHTKIGSEMAHIKRGMAGINLTDKDAAKGRKKHFNRNKREKLRRIFVATTNC